jgi:hypothetical protein
LYKEIKRLERECFTNEINSSGIIILLPYTRYIKDNKKYI